jgi:hypothetical protein
MKSACFFAIMLALLSPAEARTHHVRYAPVHQDDCYPVDTRYHHLNCGAWVFHEADSLPAPCHEAAREGGPCGCWAEYQLFGRLEHTINGWNAWLANAWLRFRHVSPSEANAAVWPGRHVAPIVPGTYDGKTITVRDSWATYPVSTRGLVFVYAQL